MLLWSTNIRTRRVLYIEIFISLKNGRNLFFFYAFSLILFLWYLLVLSSSNILSSRSSYLTNSAGYNFTPQIFTVCESWPARMSTTLDVLIVENYFLFFYCKVLRHSDDKTSRVKRFKSTEKSSDKIRQFLSATKQDDRWSYLAKRCGYGKIACYRIASWLLINMKLCERQRKRERDACTRNAFVSMWQSMPHHFLK